MVDLPKLDIIGFTSILAGFIFLVTGLLLLINSINTVPDPVSPGVLKLLGIFVAIVGIVLLTSRSD
jgi:MFS superfamily sulfate permease-like transporter